MSGREWSENESCNLINNQKMPSHVQGEKPSKKLGSLVITPRGVMKTPFRDSAAQQWGKIFQTIFFDCHVH